MQQAGQGTTLIPMSPATFQPREGHFSRHGQEDKIEK
jgi:hypothetical protein